MKTSERKENVPRQETPCNLARVWGGQGIKKGEKNGMTQVEQGRPRIKFDYCVFPAVLACTGSMEQGSGTDFLPKAEH